MDAKIQKPIEYHDNADIFLRSRARWFKENSERLKKQARIMLANGEITNYMMKKMLEQADNYVAQAKYWAKFAKQYKPKY